MYLQGNVADPSTAGSADGSFPIANMGRAQELIVTELHGKYFTQAYRGNIFLASTTSAGVAISIASTLTPTFSIWNPLGSNRLCVPIALLVGWTSTTAALGELVWTSTTQAGSGLSSTQGFSAFGSGSGVNANLGNTKVSSIRCGTGGTTTLVAAASFYRSTGLSIGVTTAATGILPGWVWRDDFDGTSILSPGSAIHLMGSTAVAAVVTATLVYADLPV